MPSFPALRRRSLDLAATLLRIDLDEVSRILLLDSAAVEINALNDRIDTLDAVVDLVRVARREGWYEDDRRWKEVETLLASVPEDPV